MKLKGNITICRCSDHTIRIEIRDELSGIEIVEATLTPEAFGNAVTGLGFMGCVLETGTLDKVGKTREHKTEQVAFEPKYDRNGDRNRAKKVLAAYEKDGWTGHVDDMFNHHRRTNGSPPTYTVNFVRWVETPAQPKSTNRKEP